MKKVIIFVLIIAVIVGVTGFFLSPFIIQKDFQKTVHADLSTVDKITIGSGSNGKTFDITGKENIRNFLAVFKGVKLKKCFDQKVYKGFIYSVTLYKSNEELGGFNFGHDLIVMWNDQKSIRYISSKNIDDAQIKEIAQKYNLAS